MVWTICLILGIALAYFGAVLSRWELCRTGGFDISPVPETTGKLPSQYLN